MTDPDFEAPRFVVYSLTMARKEDEIRKDVLDELRWDTRVDAAAVTVEVKDGIVTLGGEVPTYQERAAAVESAISVSGVKDVVNEIAIHPLDVPTLPADADIQDRIRTMLEWNTRINEADIQTSVVDGIVTLEGAVDTHWKRPYVEEIVGNIRGVVAIHNNLAVVPTRSVTDQIIAEDVVAALKRNLLVDADSIEVRVENAIVTLSGRVSSHAERKAAEGDASITSGVVEVRNKLTVGQAAA